jgi:hypothetical protein
MFGPHQLVENVHALQTVAWQSVEGPSRIRIAIGKYGEYGYFVQNMYNLSIPLRSLTSSFKAWSKRTGTVRQNRTLLA